MARKYLPESKPGHGMKLDVLGSILAPIAFASLVFGVHEAGINGC